MRRTVLAALAIPFALACSNISTPASSEDGPGASAEATPDATPEATPKATPDRPDSTPAPPDPTPAATAPPVSSARLSLSASRRRLLIGQAAVLRAIWRDSDALVDVSAEAEWHSEAPTVIDFEAPGVARARAPGSAVLVAAARGEEATLELSVEDPAAELVSLAIQPESVGLPLGYQRRLRAIGVFGDGRSEEVSGIATWRVDDGGRVARIEGATPLTVEGVSAGAARVEAELSGLEAVARIEVTPAVLESIELIPASASISVGESTRVRVLGIFSDSSRLEVTTDARFDIVDPAIAAPREDRAPGFFEGRGPGVTDVEVSVGEANATFILSVAELSVEALAITPPVLGLAVGATQQLQATASLSDGSLRQVTFEALWSSEHPGIVAVSSTPPSTGRVTGIAVGRTTLRASLGGVSAEASVEVSAADLRGLELLPAMQRVPAGRQARFALIARYSDGTRAGANRDAVWRSDDPDIAIVGNDLEGGLITARRPGSARITATLGERQVEGEVVVSEAELSGLQLIPAVASLPAGDRLSMQAVSVYSDNSLRPALSEATWRSSAPEIATVGNAPGSFGQVRGVAAGEVEITATLGGFSDAAQIEVTSAVVESLQVIPDSVALPAGRDQRLTALAVYSDGSSLLVTDRAQYAAAPQNLVQVSNAPGSQGRVTGIAPGRGTVIVELGGQTTTVEVRVLDAELEEIIVAPRESSLTAGQSQSYTAIGVYSARGVRQNLTNDALWHSSDSGVARVGNAPLAAGRVTGVRGGRALITASVSGVFGNAMLHVARREPVQLDIAPDGLSLSVNSFQNFTAIVTYADGESAEVTDDVVWSSSDNGVLTFFGGGLASALSPGEVVVTARFEGIEASTEATVRNAMPTALVLSPVNPAVNRLGQPGGGRPGGGGGGPVQFHATAVYDDGTQSDVTRLCRWTSSNADVLLVLDQQGAKGLAIGLRAGTATLSTRLHDGGVEIRSSTQVTVR